MSEPLTQWKEQKWHHKDKLTDTRYSIAWDWINLKFPDGYWMRQSPEENTTDKTIITKSRVVSSEHNNDNLDHRNLGRSSVH